MFIIFYIICIGFRYSDCDHVREQTAMDIWRIKQFTDKIIHFTVHGEGRNQTYNALAKFVDKFGSRFTGTKNLENSLDYMLCTLHEAGLENIRFENVTVPHWVRGYESAQLIKPLNKSLAILGLGTSVGTFGTGIEASVLVVRSFNELQKRSDEAVGKIVVYNQNFLNYDETVKYRSNGAAQAASYGAVATLIRSVTPFSLYTTHTGMQHYQDGIKQIPTACITVEDAEMLWRMSQRGDEIIINLTMSAKNMPPVTSRNIIAEIKGALYPDQIVLVSGHLDSWDVGQGAIDDGAGAFISWLSLSIFHQLNLRPKRTVRAVLWTGEEMGLIGAKNYWDRHNRNIDNYAFVMESDIGTFIPKGIGFSGNKNATVIMQKLVKELLVGINATQLISPASVSDISFWLNAGVPSGSLATANEKYFYYHHTNADTMTIEDPHALDLCLAAWAAVAYAVADMEDMLPR